MRRLRMTAFVTTASAAVVLLTTSAGGTQAAAPVPATKIIVFLEENHSLGALNSMPYLKSLAGKFGQAAHWSDVGHPSLPNYLAIFGGARFGHLGSDCSPSSGCQARVPSVFGQAVSAGKTAGGFEESMPSACDLTDAGEYAVQHNPWPYFFAERSSCKTGEPAHGDAALTRAVRAGLPNVSIVTPDLIDDAHDGTLAQADAWLKKHIPLVMAGKDYQSGHLAIVVVFDEGSSTELVPFVLVSPATSHVIDKTHLNHYALTALIDHVLGVSPLRNARNAPDIRPAFGLVTR